MLISTAFRNDLYISEYSLTYKRIGVYIYLLLCILGLFTTFVKIMKIKSNSFLFRINAWIFYFVLVVSCLFNWDTIITGFNITKSKHLEARYLFGLSNTNLPILYKQKQALLDNEKESQLKVDSSFSTEKRKELFSEYAGVERNLDLKLYSFLSERQGLGWKSWYFDNSSVYNSLQELDKEKKINSINLSYSHINTIVPLEDFKNIKELNLTACSINLNELTFFPSLKKLNLSYSNIPSLKGIEQLTQLEFLDLRHTLVFNYKALFELRQLKEIRVTNFLYAYQLAELQRKLPTTKIIQSE